jgi:prepilin-type processing-associated H-X9-DG protein
LDANETKPERLLSGDRNITGGVLSKGFLRMFNTNSTAGWTTSIHTNTGNIGLADGSVQQVTAQTLQRQLQIQSLDIIRLAIP